MAQIPFWCDSKWIEKTPVRFYVAVVIFISINFMFWGSMIIGVPVVAYLGAAKTGTVSFPTGGDTVMFIPPSTAVYSSFSLSTENLSKRLETYVLKRSPPNYSPTGPLIHHYVNTNITIQDYADTNNPQIWGWEFFLNKHSIISISMSSFDHIDGDQHNHHGSSTSIATERRQQRRLSALKAVTDDGDGDKLMMFRLLKEDHDINPEQQVSNSRPTEVVLQQGFGVKGLSMEYLVGPEDHLHKSKYNVGNWYRLEFQVDPYAVVVEPVMAELFIEITATSFAVEAPADGDDEEDGGDSDHDDNKDDDYSYLNDVVHINCTVTTPSSDSSCVVPLTFRSKEVVVIRSVGTTGHSYNSTEDQITVKFQFSKRTWFVTSIQVGIFLLLPMIPLVLLVFAPCIWLRYKLQNIGFWKWWANSFQRQIDEDDGEEEEEGEAETDSKCLHGDGDIIEVEAGPGSMSEKAMANNNNNNNNSNSNSNSNNDVLDHHHYYAKSKLIDAGLSLMHLHKIGGGASSGSSSSPSSSHNNNNNNNRRKMSMDPPEEEMAVPESPGHRHRRTETARAFLKEVMSGSINAMHTMPFADMEEDSDEVALLARDMREDFVLSQQRQLDEIDVKKRMEKGQPLNRPPPAHNNSNGNGNGNSNSNHEQQQQQQQRTVPVINVVDSALAVAVGHVKITPGTSLSALRPIIAVECLHHQSDDDHFDFLNGDAVILREEESKLYAWQLSPYAIYIRAIDKNKTM